MIEPFRWPEKLGRSVLELFYPGLCLCCGAPLMFKSSLRFPVCTGCQQDLSPIEENHRCSICSVPLISELELCTRCSRRNFSFAANYSIYEYRGLIRHIISQFKFSHRRSLAPFVAHLLSNVLERRYTGLPVVPVPGSRRSVRQRGWDPMIEVARALERNSGLKILSVLQRLRGGPQKGLRFEDRLANIQGMIVLPKNSRPLSQRVVLIDDIFTSGATADECARVLRRAGVREVQVLTLAAEL